MNDPLLRILHLTSFDDLVLRGNMNTTVWRPCQACSPGPESARPRLPIPDLPRTQESPLEKHLYRSFPALISRPFSTHIATMILRSIATLVSLLALSNAHNINLKAHSRECFHETLHKGDKMTVTFQVGDREFGGSGNLDVDFWVRKEQHQ